PPYPPPAEHPPLTATNNPLFFGPTPIPGPLAPPQARGQHPPPPPAGGGPPPPVGQAVLAVEVGDVGAGELPADQGGSLGQVASRPACAQEPGLRCGGSARKAHRSDE